MSRRSSGEVVRQAVALYPPALRPAAAADAARHTFQLDLVRTFAPAGGKVMDVGGGVGPFSPALALAGYRTVLVDDFADSINNEFPIDRIGVHKRLGVEVRTLDASSQTFSPEPDTYAAITCIDSIEHWHHSPRTSLHKMVDALTEGGLLLIGLPNCVNLRKRITVPLGRGKWSPMEMWYDDPIFRSHVREPDVDDLFYIARDLGLHDVSVIGRNWQGLYSPNRVVRTCTQLFDRLLRLKPSLCSDLYLIGTRPYHVASPPSGQESATELERAV